MDPSVRPIMQRIYDNYLSFCLKTEELAQEIGRAAESDVKTVDVLDQLHALNASKKNAEILVKELLMAAYFTANYRNCTRAITTPERDLSVLDGTSQAAASFREDLEKAELQKQPMKSGGGSIFGAALASPAQKRRRSLPGIETPEVFQTYMIARYKSLHGLNEKQTIGIPMMSISSSAILAGGRVLHRSDLLAEINTFIRKFNLNPIDKRDDIWRKWFLEDFLGLDPKDNNNSRPLMVLDTPQRSKEVYKHTLENVCALARKVLQE